MTEGNNFGLIVGAKTQTARQAADGEEVESSCTCEKLDLFGWTPLVECVGPALRLCLHHRIVIVPITDHHDNTQGIGELVMHVRAALLAARYLAARQLGDVIPLLFACTHVEHAVGGTHSSLREGHCFHPDVGNAFQPFPAGRMIPGNKSATATLRRDGGGVLSLDRALHRAEIVGATRIWIRDEARGGQVSLLLLLRLLLRLLLLLLLLLQ